MIDKLPTSDCAQNPVGVIKALTNRLNVLVTKFITSHWQLINYLALITPEYLSRAYRWQILTL